jgi:hypothetical protein
MDNLSSRQRIKARRHASREQAKATLMAIVSGNVDTYEGYRKLFVIYCSNSAALEEIKPMFRIPNIDPDGVFSVTTALREEVRSLAAKLLPLLSNWDGKAKPGEMVILTGLPSGFVDDLPPEDQKAITERIGQPVLLESFDDDGRAELEFVDSEGVIHFVYVDPQFIRPT